MNLYAHTKFLNNPVQPEGVAWDVTNNCNLRCKHCFNNSGDKNYYDLDHDLCDYKVILHDIIRLNPLQCCLCGGEPLLHAHIYEIISGLTSNGILTNIVSNGIAIDEKVAKKLRECKINNVQISVDGLGYQHDIFRNGNNVFDKAIDAIILLKKNNIKVLVSHCPNKYSYLDYEKFADLMYKLGVRNLRSMPLLPLGRGNTFEKEIRLNSNEQFEFISIINRVQRKYPDLKIEWGDPLQHIHMTTMKKRYYGSNFGIKSNGDITITPYVPIVVGNINKVSLSYLWEKGYLKNIWINPIIQKVSRSIISVDDLNQFSNEKIYVEVTT